MRARIRYAVDLLRNSYWFTPGIMMLGAIGLSTATHAVDERWGIEAIREVDWLYRWIYTGGPEGAADVLSVIASSMITVAGVVFSITIVALTLASSQFGPRVLANFMADRGNQVVLGTFIATFLYSLLILRTLRREAGDTGALVPHISVTVAVILALASLSVLIFFIHHVAVSIQAPHVVAVVAGELRHAAKEFARQGESPTGEGRRDQTADGMSPRNDPAATPPREEAAAIPARDTGYVEAIDYQGLVELAAKQDLLIEIEHRPGHFVVKGQMFARAWPADRMSDELSEEIAGMMATGSRRTAIQDVEFPIAQLVEIAVRALSPGINDPFTAITCIDQMSAGLCDLVTRDLPHARYVDAKGETRVAIARPITFEGAVGAAFDQIRQNAAHHAAVHIRLLETLAIVIGAADQPSRIEPLLDQAQRVLRSARDRVADATDVRDVEERYRAVAESAERRRKLFSAPRP